MMMLAATCPIDYKGPQARQSGVTRALCAVRNGGLLNAGKLCVRLRECTEARGKRVPIPNILRVDVFRAWHLPVMDHLVLLRGLIRAAVRPQGDRNVPWRAFGVSGTSASTAR
jgi:hypothetical protein